jgi:hypothetical protein
MQCGEINANADRAYCASKDPTLRVRDAVSAGVFGQILEQAEAKGLELVSGMQQAPTDR